MKNQHRHGDVLLTPLNAAGEDISQSPPPVGLQPQAKVILAYGEATGSAHAIVGEVWQWEAGGQRYVRTGPSGATLVQERYGAVLPAPEGHAAQVLAPNTTHIVLPQREATLDDEWAPVVD